MKSPLSSTLFYVACGLVASTALLVLWLMNREFMSGFGLGAGIAACLIGVATMVMGAARKNSALPYTASGTLVVAALLMQSPALKLMLPCLAVCFVSVAYNWGTHAAKHQDNTKP